MPDPTQPVPGPTREQTVTYTNWLGNQIERNAIPDRYDLAELRDLHKRAKRGPGGPGAHDAVDALVWLIDAVEALLPARPSPTDDDRRPCDGPTDYTDPATVDIDVVIGEINHAHRMRGHTWTDRPSWPNVTVAALAAEIERLRAHQGTT